MQPSDRQTKRARARELLDGLGKAGETSEELRELLELLFDLEVAAMDPKETPTLTDIRVEHLSPEKRFTPGPFALGEPLGYANGQRVVRHCGNSGQPAK